MPSKNRSQTGVGAVMKAESLLIWALALTVRGDPVSICDKKLLYTLFLQPGTPMINTIGDTDFKLPPSFMPEEYSNITLEDRMGSENQVIVPEHAIDVIPDLSFPKQLPQDAAYSMFIPQHREMTNVLCKAFLEQKNYTSFVYTVIYARSHLHPMLVNFCYSVAILHREDTQDVSLPNAASIFPGKFITGRIYKKLQDQSNAPLTLEDRLQMPIEIPMNYTTVTDKEQRLAYFREDIGMNLLHWIWHILYTFSGPREVVDKDRRGELFYYFHQQVLARYNCERMSNKLERVVPLMNWNDPIPEAYYPNLDTTLSSMTWASRPKNAVMQDLNRSDIQLYLKVTDLETWRDRLIQACREGRLLHRNGSYIPLTGKDGIDEYFNAIEASDLSVNPNEYGDCHNSGHLCIGYITDPNNTKMNSDEFGVMCDTAVSMRDPVFYRWHGFIQWLAEQQKNILPSYTSKDLSFSGIELLFVEIHTVDEQEINVLTTYWQKSDLELSRGLDFQPHQPLYVRVTHLQHAPFFYRIRVRNSGQERRGTIRLFLAPQLDENGNQLNISEQRTLFIELDRFPVTLRKGVNIFRRNSNLSSVTVPYEQTFFSINVTDVPENSSFCGCGWPQHMLIPKGTAEGLKTVLFAMVTDYEEDQIQRLQTHRCRDGWSYCGVHRQKYPDKRPMGYPWDVPLLPNIKSLESFKKLGSGNMYSVDVTINHIDNLGIE